MAAERQKSVRIGIVGAGTNTKSKHIPNFQKIPGVEIVSVCNRSPESSRQVASQFKIAETPHTWRDLVCSDSIDAVMIGTWPYMHCPVTLMALNQGKHVLCEARMARDLKEARAMLNASVQRPDLITQVVPSPFTLSVDKTIKKHVNDGTLGDILALEIRQNGNFIDREGDYHWRHDTVFSGLNIMALGILYEAVLRWVGDAKTVMAMGKTFVKTRRDPASGQRKAIHIPDHLDVIAEMGCGAQAHFALSAVAGIEPGIEFTIFGSKAKLRFVKGQLLIQSRDDSALKVLDIAEEDLGGWRVEEEFINSIRGTEVITHTTFQDGVRYMVFVDAVSQSMREQKAVSVPFF